MDLAMARGDDALDFPEEVLEVALATDLAIDRDLELAGALALRELELIQEAELARGRRLHKGHALHNRGAALIGRDQAAARRLFYAAFVEDARTEPESTDPKPAQKTIQELYGDTTAALGRLGDLGRVTTEDPLLVAERYEQTEETLPPFRGGAMSSVRRLASLDGIDQQQLIFVGGGYAAPEGVLALRAAVVDFGRIPVIVAEFEEFTTNVHVKSETLMARCSAGLLDVTRGEAGWREELPIADKLGLPLFLGHVAKSSGEPPHHNDMTKGLEERLELESVGTVSSAQLRAEGLQWLRRQVATGPIDVSFRPPEPFDYGSPAMGTATRTAIGSNTPMRIWGGQTRLEFVSGAMPSGATSINYRATIPTPDFKLVDGKLVREERDEERTIKVYPDAPKDRPAE